MSDSVWEIAARAGIRLRRRVEPKPFDNQFVCDLVAMRRAGLFQAVFIDADRISVLTLEQEWNDHPQPLSRVQAENFIAEWRRANRGGMLPRSQKRRVSEHMAIINARSTFSKLPARSEVAKSKAQATISQ